ncbi:hypothetical protein FRC08_002483 [Ceratobasidium sp. 394]|nr:hypothetical protein FRC08_002483 [Ceratobasidium sp. 394]
MAERLNDILTPAVRNKYKDLGRLMCEHFGWESAHQFQIDGTLLQLLRHDTIVHVGTGRGKTAVAAGPFVLPENAQKVTIVVSPLIALQEEMKQTFENTFKLRAIVINSSTTSSLSDILLEIKSRKIRIILISPETLLSRRIIDGLLWDPNISKMIFSVIIDEAHCVSFWSDTFRKKYGALHIIRPFLPRDTPIVALSATLTPRVRRDIITRLNLSSRHLFINEGNDKPNLTIMAARCKYPLISLYDLAFIIPSIMFHPLDIPTTMVYADNIDVGQRIVRFLTSLLPLHLQNAGIIRPYNAHLTHEYRTLAMKGLREGNIRVLVCTDAAGMGCDLSNIERVVQWRVIGLSMLIQRWGWCGRSGANALGILLYEPSAENINPTRSSTQSSQSTRALGKPTKGHKQRPALLKGGFRSSIAGAEPDVQDDSPGEGVYALIQTKGCRRRIWNKVYGNEPVALTAPCCDRCMPSVLDQIKTIKPSVERKPKVPPKGIPFKSAQRELVKWRESILKRDFNNVTWASRVILPHDMVELLTSYGPINTRELFEQLVRKKADEEWWEAYGEELAGVVLGLHIEYVPVPPKPKNSKKHVLDSASENNTNKRTKNTHSSTSSDLTRPIVGATHTYSFQVNPQPPPPVDVESQSAQTLPVLASFSVTPTRPFGYSSSASTSASPQFYSSASHNPAPPPSIYQQAYPTYPPPIYPYPTHPYPAPPYPTYPHNQPVMPHSHSPSSPAAYLRTQIHQPQAQWGRPPVDMPNQPQQTDVRTVYQNSTELIQQNAALYAPATSSWNSAQQPAYRAPSRTAAVQAEGSTSSPKQVRTQANHPEPVHHQKTYAGYCSSFRVRNSHK